MLLRSTALLRSRWPRQRRSRGSGGRRLVGLMRSCGRATAALWAGDLLLVGAACMHGGGRRTRIGRAGHDPRAVADYAVLYNPTTSNGVARPCPGSTAPFSPCMKLGLRHTAAPCCPNESSSKPRFGAIILCINRLQNNVSKASLQPSLPDLVAHAQKPSSSCRWPSSHELFA